MADRLADEVRREVEELGLDADPVVADLVAAAVGAAEAAPAHPVDGAGLTPAAAATVVLAPFAQAVDPADRSPADIEQRAAALALADEARGVLESEQQRGPRIDELSDRELLRLVVGRTLRGRWRRG